VPPVTDIPPTVVKPPAPPPPAWLAPPPPPPETINAVTLGVAPGGEGEGVTEGVLVGV
jgi:hypothetical protein